MDELRIPDVIVKDVIDKIQESGICICGTELGPDHQEHLEGFKKNRASRDVSRKSSTSRTAYPRGNAARMTSNPRYPN